MAAELFDHASSSLLSDFVLALLDFSRGFFFGRFLCLGGFGGICRRQHCRRNLVFLVLLHGVRHDLRHLVNLLLLHLLVQLNVDDRLAPVGERGVFLVRARTVLHARQWRKDVVNKG